MSFTSLKRPRILFGGGAGVAAVTVLALALGSANVGAASTKTVAAAATPTTSPNNDAPHANVDPFGAPTGNGDYKVPAPPESPTLVPTIGTKTTQRLYGADPFQEAVSITQHIWPSAVPLNAPSGNDTVPDRPRAVTLLTPDDPLTAITATPLVHFPDDAPVLYVN